MQVKCTPSFSLFSLEMVPSLMLFIVVLHPLYAAPSHIHSGYQERGTSEGPNCSELSRPYPDKHDCFVTQASIAVVVHRGSGSDTVYTWMMMNVENVKVVGTGWAICSFGLDHVRFLCAFFELSI